MASVLLGSGTHHVRWHLSRVGTDFIMHDCISIFAFAEGLYRYMLALFFYSTCSPLEGALYS